ncbi:MAG: cob(I)yrinic acid a,c-diamide adenosyltransferase [Actinobacteria bacterium]|nr:cob(I)yrinic acid a,c-diamide adenosyltransferase [Actinomycetota bacterium]
MSLEIGRVHVYTGESKGKTTAAVGLALRATGQGLKVRVIQFMKANVEKSGDIQVLEKLTGHEVLRFGHSLLGDRTEIIEEDYEEARLGLAEARRALASGRCDLLVLDEINVAAHFGLLSVDDLVDLIASKPIDVELVLTGRHAHPRLINLADYVTEMTLIKHPYISGDLTARRGIEF